MSLLVAFHLKFALEICCCGCFVVTHDAPWLDAGDKTDESREAEAATAEDSEGENSPDELPAKQRKALGLGLASDFIAFCCAPKNNGHHQHTLLSILPLAHS